MRKCILVIAIVLLGLFAKRVFEVYQKIQIERSEATSTIRLEDLLSGISEYRRVVGQYPPLFISSSNGEKLFSWRASVLPYCDMPELPVWDFEKPWNDPANSKWVELEYLIFQGEGSKREVLGATNFVAVTGNSTFWNAPADKHEMVFSPSQSDSMAIVLELPTSDIHWCEPREIDTENAISSILNSDRRLALGFLSGRVEFVDRSSYSREQLEELFSVKARSNK